MRFVAMPPRNARGRAALAGAAKKETPVLKGLPMDTPMRAAAGTVRPTDDAPSVPLLELAGPSSGKPLPDVMDLLESTPQVLSGPILASYVHNRRWFGGKDEPVSSCRIVSICRLSGSDPVIALCEAETIGWHSGKENAKRWLLPLAIVLDDELQGIAKELAVAGVHCDRNIGLLTDAFFLPAFAHRMLDGLVMASLLPATEGNVVFECPEQERGDLVPADRRIKWLGVEQSNSSLIVGGSVMLKIFRRIGTGPHPEAEMTRYLTERGFMNSPRLLGEVARIDPSGRRHTLAVAQAFVANQGDAWAWTLERFAQRMASSVSDGKADAYDEFAAAIGRRLGEMHLLLAAQTDDKAFAPRAAQPEDVKAWIVETEQELGRAYKALSHVDAEHAGACRADLLELRTSLLAALPRLAVDGVGSVVTRIHGDFHLGQVLVTDGDAYIIDFEGEPAKRTAERRAKASPLNDVAGMLRSFHYAAAFAAADERRGDEPPATVGRKVLAPMVASAETAFLNAYRTTIRGLSGLENRSLLDLFVVRKAAYEITYEAANRPAWLAVPMEGLLQIARRVTGAAVHTS